jgi:predicted DNA-binding protein
MTKNRTKSLLIRLSEEEHEKLRALAEDAGMPMASLLRDHVKRVTVRNRDDERRRIALLNRINSNLNQIAKWANTYKAGIDAERVCTLVYILDKTIERLIQRIGEDMDEL